LAASFRTALRRSRDRALQVRYYAYRSGCWRWIYDVIQVAERYFFSAGACGQFACLLSRSPKACPGKCRNGRPRLSITEIIDVTSVQRDRHLGKRSSTIDRRLAIEKLFLPRACIGSAPAVVEGTAWFSSLDEWPHWGAGKAVGAERQLSPFRRPMGKMACISQIQASSKDSARRRCRSHALKRRHHSIVCFAIFSSAGASSIMVALMRGPHKPWGASSSERQVFRLCVRAMTGPEHQLGATRHRRPGRHLAGRFALPTGGHGPGQRGWRRGANSRRGVVNSVMVATVETSGCARLDFARWNAGDRLRYGRHRAFPHR